MIKNIYSPYIPDVIVNSAFYKINDGAIVIIEDSLSQIFSVNKGYLQHIGYTWEKDFENLKMHPATRKELKEAGLWDMVVNKNNYSSKDDQIESELEEYLRIGEEAEKEKK